MRSTKTKVLWALAALNAVLLSGMIFRGSNTATAQVGPGRSVPGDYIMVPGAVVGGNGDVIYMLDETNRKLTARAFDVQRRELVDMVPIDLDRVFQMAASGANPGAGAGAGTGGRGR